MERCDFCSVMTIIRKYISEGQEINQVDLMYELFESFMNDDDNVFFYFDNGLVCRWFKGLAKISPHITKYYLNNRSLLADDIEHNILRYCMTVQWRSMKSMICWYRIQLYLMKSKEYLRKAIHVKTTVKKQTISA